MRRIFQFVSLVGLWTLTACGPQPTPAVNFVPLVAEEKQMETPGTIEITIPLVQNANVSSPVVTPVSPVSRPATEIGEDGSAVLLADDFPADIQPLLAQATQTLTGLPQAQIAAADVRVSRVEVRHWPDASLGCPQADMMYAAMITPGYLLELRAGGKTYEFHTDSVRTVVLCAIDGQNYHPAGTD